LCALAAAIAASLCFIGVRHDRLGLHQSLHDSCHSVSLLESVVSVRKPVRLFSLVSRGRHRPTNQVKAGNYCVPLLCSPNQQLSRVQISEMDHRVRHRIFDLGGRSGRIETAKAELLAADFAFNDVHRLLIYQVESGYHHEDIHAKSFRKGVTAEFLGSPMELGFDQGWIFFA
jgi:hypothetical protein